MALAVVTTVVAAGTTVVVAPGEAHLASRPRARPNRQPSAVITASPTTGVVPLQVRFDASGSRDPDGYVLTYAWDFGDATMGSGVTATHFFNAPGAYAVSLTVTDNRGASVSSSTTVTVAPAAVSSPAPPPAPAPPPETGTAATGWAIYDMNADPGHDLSVVPKLDTDRPGVVRWMVSVDRYMPNGRVNVDWSAYAPFFRKVRDVGARLVITLWVNGQCWSGTGAAPFFGWCPNGGLIEDGWAADNMRLWLKDPADSYRPFLEGLLDAALAYVPAEQISVAPWNEPDLRFTLLAGAQSNYVAPWVNGTTYGLDNGFWTGGTAKMAELYGIVKDVLARKTGGRAKLSSNLVFEDWVGALASQVETLELHAYMNEPAPRASQVVDRVGELVARWDRYKPGLAFTVTETGVITYPERNVTAAEAAELRAAHAELARRYGARYQGMALHTGVPSFSGTLPWWDPAYTGA